jgi:hypothetical protein
MEHFAKEIDQYVETNYDPMTDKMLDKQHSFALNAIATD